MTAAGAPDPVCDRICRKNCARGCGGRKNYHEAVRWQWAHNKGQFRDIERHFRLFESWRRAASAMMSLLS